VKGTKGNEKKVVDMKMKTDYILDLRNVAIFEMAQSENKIK